MWDLEVKQEGDNIFIPREDILINKVSVEFGNIENYETRILCSSSRNFTSHNHRPIIQHNPILVPIKQPITTIAIPTTISLQQPKTVKPIDISGMRLKEGNLITSKDTIIHKDSLIIIILSLETSLQLFKYFFNYTLLDKIKDEINLFAAQKNPNKLNFSYFH